MESIEDALSNLISSNKKLSETRNLYKLYIDEGSSIPQILQKGNEMVYLQQNAYRQSFKLNNFLAKSIESLRGIISPDTSTNTITTGEDTEKNLNESVDDKIMDQTESVVPDDSQNTIFIDNRFKEKVRLYNGEFLTKHDVRNDHFPLKSHYITFRGSNLSFFGVRSIGYICIENRGKTPIQLGARKRGTSDFNAKKPNYVRIEGRMKYYFDFKGEWCLEIVSGDFKSIAVVDYSTSGGSGLNNLTKMV